LTIETSISEKKFRDDTLFISYFHANPVTLLLEILGERTDTWAVPYLKFWGDRPP